MPFISTRYESVSLSVLEDYVKSLPFSGLDILVAAFKISNPINVNHPDPRKFVPASLLAFASIVAKGASGNIDSLTQIPDEILNDLAERASAADGMAGTETHVPPSLYDTVRILCRVVGLPTALQGAFRCRLVRFTYILGLVEISLPRCKAQPLPIYSGDQEYTIECMQEQFTFLFWMFANRKHGVSFTANDLVKSAADYPRLMEEIDKSLPYLSFSVDEAKKHEKDCNHRGINGFSIPYDLMARKPFLMLDEERYLRMPGAYQQLAASHGLFYRFRQFLLRRRKTGDPKAEEVLNILGERFEYYCFLLMNECLRDMQPFPEIIYDIKRSKKSPDGIFYRNTDGMLVIMQAKLKPPTGGLLLGDTSIDFNKHDLNNAYAEMFCESIRFLYDIKRQYREGRISDEARELFDGIKNAKKIQLICLAPTLPPVFHWGPGLEILRNAIHEKLAGKSPEALRMYERLQRDGTIKGCPLLCDPEPFEIHSFKKPGISVLYDIDSWWDGIQNSRITYSGLPIDLREYIVESSDGLQPKEDQLVGSLWEEVQNLFHNVLGVSNGKSTLLQRFKHIIREIKQWFLRKIRWKMI